MKTKRKASLFLCLSMVLCLIPTMPAFADVKSSTDVAAEERTVWVSSDFSTMDDGWVLSNGMYYDGADGVIRIDESTGTENNIAEANYSLAGFDFGDNWNIRFKMKLEEEHQGRVDFHFIYGGYRTYCVVTPEENRFALQGNGSRTDRETLKGIWYEYLFQYYIEDGVTKVKIWRRPEGDDTWLDIFTGYPFGEVNLYTGPPALRFFGGAQGDNKKYAIDDIRVYSGTYARLSEPFVQGQAVTVNGVVDTSDYGITEQRQVTLIAASYDKKSGYTKEIQSKVIVLEPGAEVLVNHTFHFSSLNMQTDYVETMMWDSIESGVPLAFATGSMDNKFSNAIPDLDQETGIRHKIFYNQVELNGFLGKENEKFTASLTKDGMVCAITQGVSDETGMVSAKLSVNPILESGAYTLRIQYGTTPATNTPVNLRCSDSMVEFYGSLEEILGFNVAPYKAMDFKHKNALSLYGDVENGYHTSGSRYFNRVTGMYLNSSNKVTYWRYAPASNWFVLGDKRSVLFRAKMFDETSPLELRIFDPNKGYAAHQVVLTGNGISTDCPYKSLSTEFVPGTEWVDYLVVKTGTGIKVYASQDSVLCGRWILVLETTGVASDLVSSIGGIHFVGTGFISFLNINNASSEQAECVESIMGGTIAPNYDFSMDESFLKTVDLSQKGTLYESKGLTLTAGEWRFLPADSWYALGENNAIFIRTRFHNLTDNLSIRLSSKNGTAKIQLSAIGITAQTGIGTARKLTSFSGTEWVDYLIIQNSLGGYTIYATNDTLSNWYKAAETEDFPELADDSVGIEITGTGVVQAVRQYVSSGVVSDILSQPVNAKIPFYLEEFLEVSDAQSNVKILSGRVEDGNLILDGTKGRGTFTVHYGAIPLGGYAEFRLQSDGVAEFSTTDGVKGITILMESGSYSLMAASNRPLPISDGGNRFKTWRVVRNTNGTYSGYYKGDEENAWYPAFLNVVGYADDAESATSFSVSDGSLICDYLMIYGSNEKDNLLLTDGYGTKILEKDEPYLYHDCIRAMVRLDESEPQTILFTEYVRGVLSHWETREIPSGNGYLSIPYSVSNIAADVKVFLWDSLPGMTAMGSAKKASHSWSLRGRAKDLNGGISLNLESSDSSSASFIGEIGESFDIEWSMKINHFRGTESASVYTGTHQIRLSFNRDGITYLTKSGTQNIVCSVGTDTHSYRLIGKSGVCYLYLDGAYIATLTDFPESTEVPRIDFQTGS